MIRVSPRLASWSIGIVFPVLMVCVSRLGPNAHGAGSTQMELFFLVVGAAFAVQTARLLWHGGGLRTAKAATFDITLRDDAVVWLGQITGDRRCALEMWATNVEPLLRRTDVAFWLRCLDPAAADLDVECRPALSFPPWFLRGKSADVSTTIFPPFAAGPLYEYGVSLVQASDAPRTLCIHAVPTLSLKAALAP